MTHRLAKLATLLIAGSLVISACGGEATPQEPVPTVTETAIAEPTPEPEPVVSEDLLQACDFVFGGEEEIPVFDKIPDMLINFPETMDVESGGPYLFINQELERAIKIAPHELQVALEEVRIPFKAVADAFENGGGSLSSDSSKVALGLMDATGICADAGYRLNN